MLVKKLGKFFNIKTVIILIAVLYVIIFSSICIWKYNNYLYNGMDLAIFNQVFFNTAQGDYFGSSIHPPSYLGDHFTPFVLFLTPFYLIWKDPRMLLVLQTIILSLGVWPLYLINKNLIKNNENDKSVLIKLSPLIIALVYLFNPFIQNH